ncbi:TIGR02301 family protein [Ciceribacter ferrooxidans]|uniref:TIGR02301 family protein n=1 Tax=Ciceribacter ferrooxidans TaxID=2509717 RepID=A0A4Q2TEP1_9HYPH|nr:TIGR02301 family protein [Ciceribacter ferrooxidans]RYC17812.1 TIGR02301 family protein [Ciceribacter ferrooxidans]
MSADINARPRLSTAVAVALLVALLGALPVVAQEAPPPPVEPQEKPAPYDSQLIRLSEVIGAVQYLRNLCSGSSEPEWRRQMEKLLETETAGEPKRRERMVAAYNRGYRSFASVYTTCTPSAVTAAERYRAEGATLATEIATRYGN